MANTYTALATVTVGSGGAADITFSSIPATYTDLLMVASTRSTVSGTYDTMAMQFNGSTASNYSARLLYGDGASAASASSSSNSFINFAGYAVASLATSNTFSNNVFYIPNYTSSNAKSLSIDGVTENNGTTALADLTAGLWSLTNAITSIKLYSANAGNFAQYSTATLYGIKNS